MDQRIAKVSKVRPAGGRILRVRFVGDRREHEIDLTSVFTRSRHLAPLMSDDRAFSTPKIVENGLGVAWPIETQWGHLDLSAETLRRLADEPQRSRS
jgi:hypothetical protein